MHVSKLLLTSIFFLYSTGLIAQSEFVPGRIIDRISCKKDSLHTYSLYLPSTYDPAEKWPVLFIYHASGLGKQSVQTFQEAAERFGYIVVGSYNFRNGSMLQAVEAATILFEEIPQRFSVDENRYFTSGLSGGARMASSMAINMPNVIGVIASAAGFNSAIPPASGHDYMYVSVMGREDFNYAELIQTHDKLDRLEIPNRMISFDGRHHWPPSDQLVEAMAWLEIFSMKKELKVPQLDFIQSFKDGVIARAKEQVLNEELVEAKLLCNRASNVLQGLTEIEEIHELVQEIDKIKGLKKQVKSRSRLFQSELADQQLILKELSKPSTDSGELSSEWWKTSLSQWLRTSRNGRSEKDRHRAQRLLNFTAIYALPYGGNHLRQRQLDKAIHYYQIVHWSHPDLPDLTYLMAKLYALNGQRQNAIEYFKKAMDLGYPEEFDDKEAVFSRLKDTSEFQSLLGSMWKGLI